MSRERIYALDLIRGVAVLGMILHHTLFAVEEVSALFGAPVSFAFFLDSRLFWVLQELFVGAFLLVSGICTAFSRSVLRRGLIVSAAAAAVTLATGILLPLLGLEGLEIWFGILHLFGLSMLLYGLFTFPKRIVPALTAVVLFALYLSMMLTRGSGWSNALCAVIGLPAKGFFSADYYPLLPYFLLFLAGTFLGRPVKERRLPARFYTLRARPIEWVGRHSLWIYLIHQPVIFGVAALVFWLICR